MAKTAINHTGGNLTLTYASGIKTIIQSLPKIWLHLYIEKIPHFLRIQSFYIKMRVFRQCNLYRRNIISVIDAPL